jgi:hypothetical protein
MPEIFRLASPENGAKSSKSLLGNKSIFCFWLNETTVAFNLNYLQRVPALIPIIVIWGATERIEEMSGEIATFKLTAPNGEWCFLKRFSIF